MCVLCAKMLQSHLTLRVMDCSPLGSSFQWIFQAEYWVAMSSSPGYLPDPGIEPGSLKFPALAGEFFTTCATWEAHLPANLRDFSESSLLTFGPDLDLQFFYSVTRGGWFIRKQCFFLGEGEWKFIFYWCAPQKGKWHTFIFFRQLVPYYPLLSVCGQGFRLAQ